jgi:hypothetical protein
MQCKEMQCKEMQCKEMPVIPVNRVVDKKRIIVKNEGQGGREAQGVADHNKMYIHNLKWFVRQMKY